MDKRYKVPLREKIRVLMDPYTKGGNKWSLFIDIFILISILISSLLIPLEHKYPQYRSTFWNLELIFTSIFIIEYILRLYCSKNRFKYPFTPFAIIDLIAILPTIMMLSPDFILLRGIRGVRLLRLLRLLRLIRILKFLRYGFMIYRTIIDLKIRFNSFKEQNNLSHMTKLFYFTIIAWALGSNALYLTETNLTDEAGPFSSYWGSYWHILIVLISGIEDKEPLTLIGRVEVTVMLILGICLVGIITGEIVSILVKKIQQAGKVRLKPLKCYLEHHIIILGTNIHIDSVISQIDAALKGLYYIIVVSPDADQLPITDPKVYKKVMAVVGDPLNPSILSTLHIENASRVIILSNKKDKNIKRVDDKTLMEAVAIYNRNRDIDIVVELQNSESLKCGSIMDGVEFMVGRGYGEKLISQAVLNKGVTKIYTDLMTFTGDTNEFYTITPPDDLIGKTFKEIQLYFLDKDDEAVIPIGIDSSKNGHKIESFKISPNKDSKLKKGDKLIIISFELPSFVKIDQEALWSGKIFSNI